MKNSVLEEKARRYMEIKKQIALLTAEQDELKATMLAELKARKKDEIMVNGIIISMTEVNSTRLDSTLLKEQQPGIFEEYSYISPSVRLTVK
jgi:predicted phage-related endonuclease